MPTQTKVQFDNAAGQQLAASLAMPDRTVPRAMVLFAHCFTCGKDIAAAARISRTLTGIGFAVFRFDFTGLGGSEGDFGNTNFSSNTEDLLAAAAYLRENHAAPSLLIGHSLGGTAVLATAEKIPEVLAVATIGAPASPEHVLGRLALDANDELPGGDAELAIGPRTFRIKQQFLDDVRAESITDRLGRLDRALLIMHAPGDAIVSIDEASKLFAAARHPKSFISLDNADHLLARLADAQYAAQAIAAWVQRYLPATDEVAPARVAGGEVWVGEADKKFLRDVASDDHAWLADEPTRVGGRNLGPDPYEHLLAALGTCTSMTIRMYANHKQWPLDDVEMWLTHDREHRQDCEDCEKGAGQLDVIRRRIALYGELSDQQRERLLEIADRCPVHRTLRGDLQIDTSAAN